jgi:hypothetical protein
MLVSIPNNTPRKIGDCDGCNKVSIKSAIDSNIWETQIPVYKLHSKSMYFCEECYQKEIDAQISMVTADPVIQQNRLNIALNTARQIDESITVRTDLFNAATVSIVELKQSILDNETITNKPFALAEELMKRFTHFKSVVFELNQQIIEAGNQQKAIQIYLNQLSNQLRQDEREKLRIADISYKPLAPKSIGAKVIKTTTTSHKIDKVELRKYAAELGVSEFTLQMLVVQKGITVAVAANLLRNSINESKSK